MGWARCSSGAWVLVVALLSAFGCGASGSMTHLIPEGYVGPVVIVFDDPKGKAPKRDENGGVVYEIPPRRCATSEHTGPRGWLLRHTTRSTEWGSSHRRAAPVLASNMT